MRHGIISGTRDFDPFEFNHLYSNIRHRPTYVLSVLGIVMIAVVVAVTLLEGTFGRTSDFQLMDDLKRILGISGPPESQAYFPLVRDGASWVLLSIIIAGAMLLHRQWQLMARCISGLTENGALLAKRSVDDLRSGKGLRSRLLGLNKILATCSPEDALPTLVDRVMERLRKIRLWISLSIGVVASILSTLLILGERQGLFQTLAPRGLTPAQHHAWVDSAYVNWWAGESHPAGHIIYTIFAFMAIFIILSFNTVGVVAIYMVIALKFVTRPSADWLNRDGHYGWSPLAAVYRTVLMALGLLGAALATTIVVLGPNNFSWISFLIVMYAVLLPVFIITPRTVFSRVERAAREDRIGQIVRVIQRRCLFLDDDIDKLAPFVAEIKEANKARIRPFRLRTVSLSTFIFLSFLPIVIGIAQILFSGR